MRITFFGNQDNNAFKLAISLRRIGQDVSLYFFPGGEGIRSYPELRDPTLSEGYPEWIYPLALDVERTAIMQEICQNSDAIIVSGFLSCIYACEFPAEAPPIFVYSTGVANLGVFDNNPERARKKIITLSRADAIFMGSPYTSLSLQVLGLQSKARIFGEPEDVQENHKVSETEEFKRISSVLMRYNRVFLWLSRTVLDPAASGYKGPEIYLEALKIFFEKNPSANVHCVHGAHGADHEVFQAMVRDAGLSDRFTFVPHLAQHDLLYYLAQPNVVLFDNLYKCISSSGIAREAWSVGCVVVRNQDQIGAAVAYGSEPPVRVANSVETAAACMDEFYVMNDADFAAERVKVSSWALQYLDYSVCAQRFLLILMERFAFNRQVQQDRDLMAAGGRRMNEALLTSLRPGAQAEGDAVQRFLHYGDVFARTRALEERNRELRETQGQLRQRIQELAERQGELRAELQKRSQRIRDLQARIDDLKAHSSKSE